ncbi:hypothetical protein ANAPRD1_01088 [Anaplasma phagocytophilum]|nr:hypothetical protein ANAPRD1_01088 [Anaplasma phagocytophilum]
MLAASSQGLLQAHLFRPAIVPPAFRGFPGPGGAVKNGTFGDLLPSFNAAETSHDLSGNVACWTGPTRNESRGVRNRRLRVCACGDRSRRARDVNGTCVRACGLVRSGRGERPGLTAETGLDESVTSTGRVCVRGAWRAQERERGMT